MSLDERTPVIVGAGQFLNRVDSGSDPLCPTDLMAQAASIADRDAGVALAGRADVVAAVPTISWRHRDAALLVAEAVGATDAHTWYPAMGGNTPGMMLNRMAGEIASGNLEVGLLVGGEAWHTRSRSLKADTRPDWPVQDESVQPDWGSTDSFEMGHPAEHAREIFQPVQTYPLFETALIHAALTENPGRTLEDQIALVGQMWAGFSKVAAANPHAWRREELTASEITTADSDNRFVGWPYTKRMVSNPDVDMSSALIVTSAAAARSAGVSRDRWVHCWSGTDGKDRVMSERHSFTRSPSIGVAGRRSLELCGVDLDDVAHLDVYSCFPSAVELFCREFGLDPLERQLTVYGGLAFAGGPWNNPVGHALATMVDVLRNEAGSLGLVTGNGGNVDKHSFGLLGTEPPPDGFRHEAPQREIEAETEGREVLETHSGQVEIEAWTVMHDRDNASERLHAACLTSSGERVWGVSTDADAMLAAESRDLGGTAAEIAADGQLTLAG